MLLKKIYRYLLQERAWAYYTRFRGSGESFLSAVMNGIIVVSAAVHLRIHFFWNTTLCHRVIVSRSFEDGQVL